MNVTDGPNVSVLYPIAAAGAGTPELEPPELEPLELEPLELELLELELLLLKVPELDVLPAADAGLALCVVLTLGITVSHPASSHNATPTVSGAVQPVGGNILLTSVTLRVSRSEIMP